MKVIKVISEPYKIKTSYGKWAVKYIGDLPYINWKTGIKTNGRKQDLTEYFYTKKEAQEWIKATL